MISNTTGGSFVQTMHYWQPPNHFGSCPSCGRCNQCGRGGYDFHQPTIWWGTTTLQNLPNVQTQDWQSQLQALVDKANAKPGEATV